MNLSNFTYCMDIREAWEKMKLFAVQKMISSTLNCLNGYNPAYPSCFSSEFHDETTLYLFFCPLGFLQGKGRAPKVRTQSTTFYSLSLESRLLYNFFTFFCFRFVVVVQFLITSHQTTVFLPVTKELKLKVWWQQQFPDFLQLSEPETEQTIQSTAQCQ